MILSSRQIRILRLVAYVEIQLGKVKVIGGLHDIDLIKVLRNSTGCSINSDLSLFCAIARPLTVLKQTRKAVLARNSHGAVSELHRQKRLEFKAWLRHGVHYRAWDRRPSTHLRNEPLIPPKSIFLFRIPRRCILTRRCSRGFVFHALAYHTLEYHVEMVLGKGQSRTSPSPVRPSIWGPN